ncbi:MAG: DUF4145 domain-containing protein, partial [Thermoprotei archaeon]
MPTTVLSVRIDKRLKEEIEELGIDVRAVVERALREEVRRVKLERFKRLVEKALSSMEISINEWIKAVKETR